MKFLSSASSEKYKTEICLINLIILSYLFRAAIPLLKFPFLFLYICSIVYYVLNYKKEIFSNLLDFVRNYSLLLLLAIVLVISFLFSNKLYLTVFKDVVNMIILLSVFFMATITVRGKNELSFFVFNLVSLIVLFAFLTSVLGLLDFFDVYSYIDYSKETISNGQAASIDYNFALLPAFFGIISIFYFLPGTDSKPKRLYYNILLLFFFLDILMSGSRRGLITFILIVSILMVAQIYVFYRRNTLLGNLGVNSRYFLLWVFLLSALSVCITFKAGYSFKIKMLELIGSKNISNTKEKIAVKIFKYVSISAKKYSFMEFYSLIWPVVPEDPDSGWGTRVHKTIYPLTGKNVEIVPKGSKGYLMDSTCNSDFYSEINLCESLTYVVKLKVNNDDRYKASVYCFVSENFDGNSVSFGNIFSSIEKKIVTGNAYEYYDLKNKGIWKKLEIEFDCNHGEAPIVLSFTKNGVKNLSKLRGYVIFAYPTYEKLISSENKSSHNVAQKKDNQIASGGNKSLNYLVKTSNSNNCCDSIHSSVFFSSLIISRTTNSKAQKYYFSSISSLPLSAFFLSKVSPQDDPDPVRNWVSKFISEDSTYYPFKKSIIADTISNSFSGPRTARWSFALKIFTQEYSWSKKIFGSGFNFLNWYGYAFYADKTRSDYPHNPFLSILLYSGILGLLLYLIFMYKVFQYYIKYFKEYKILSVFFIITFFFSFFSAGSPFDPPIMGFFVILPFFIHSVHKKIKLKQSENNAG